MSRLRIPKLRHHKASGQGFVELCSHRFYLGRFGLPETRERYDRTVAEWLANGRQLPVDPEEITVTEVIARFWRWAEGYYRKPDGTPTTELDHFRFVLRGLRHLYGRSLAGEFGPRALRAYRAAAVEGRLVGMRGPASRRYANELTRRVKQLFRWAVEHELVPPAMYQALRVVPGLKRGRTDARETDPVCPVRDHHVAVIRPHVSRQVWALVQLQLLTGARSGELVILRPGEIDRRTADVWVYRPHDHKTAHHGIRREIFIGPKAQDVLRPFVDRDAETYCFDPREAEAERLAELHDRRKTPLSCGNRPGSNRRTHPKQKPGKRYTTGSYRRAIQRACDLAGIAPWHPHQLRHSRATEVRALHGVEAAQVLLGHQRADVTQVYAERDRRLALEVARNTG